MQSQPISDEMNRAVAQRVLELQQAYETWNHLRALKDERWLKSILKAWNL